MAPQDSPHINKILYTKIKVTHYEEELLMKGVGEKLKSTNRDW